MARETARHLLRRPATVLYPFQRLTLPAGFRGRPALDTEKCIGCRICERDCPAGAITMVQMAEKVLRPGFFYDRCAFCAQCSESCPKDAITMTDEYELAAFDRQSLYGAPAMPRPKDPEIAKGKAAGAPARGA